MNQRTQHKMRFALPLLPQMLPRGHLPTIVNSVKSWSGRRDSNPRPRPWQGRTVPYRALTNHHERTEETPNFIDFPGFFHHLSYQVIKSFTGTFVFPQGLKRVPPARN